MNERALLIQGSIGCPAHLREWRGNQGERLLQTRKQAGAESNQTATFMDTREGELGSNLCHLEMGMFNALSQP